MIPFWNIYLPHFFSFYSERNCKKPVTRRNIGVMMIRSTCDAITTWCRDAIVSPRGDQVMKLWRDGPLGCDRMRRPFDQALAPCDHLHRHRPQWAIPYIVSPPPPNGSRGFSSKPPRAGPLGRMLKVQGWIPSLLCQLWTSPMKAMSILLPCSLRLRCVRRRSTSHLRRVVPAGGAGYFWLDNQSPLKIIRILYNDRASSK